jgi:endonuclease/exonuclease/phosphatase family metal-dependent hydrolase
MTRAQIYRVIEVSSVLLFLLQALKVMFSVLFGIIYDGIFEGPFATWTALSVLLLLLALLTPIWVTNQIRLKHLSILAIFSALFRIMLCINVAEIRYWGALGTILASVLYISGVLKIQRSFLRIGFILALSLDQFFRVVGFTYDVSLRTWFLPIQVIWMIGLVLMGIRLMEETREGEAGGVGLRNGLVLGGFLFLQTSLLSLPNAIARWSGSGYEWIAPLLLLITTSYLYPSISSWVSKIFVSRSWVKVVFVLFLLVGLMAGYFLSGTITAVCLLLTHVVSIGLLLFSIEADSASGKRTGVSIAIGMVLFLVLNFLNAFAFTYPYTLPALREMGWSIFLAAGILMGVSIFGGTYAHVRMEMGFSKRVLIPILVATLVAVIFIWPVKTTNLAEAGTIRVATYNIHYGYDDDWHYTLDKIAQTIRENDCDVVAMQEVDTGRMTSYLVDNAYYLARTLKMQVAYLPAVEHLTGIGMLYRGPKVKEDLQLISSLQEQTGIIGLSIGDPESPIHTYGIWMGLSKEDTERQISEALDFIGDNSPATFGGDFNADPDSQVADSIREAGFMDPFQSLGVDPAPNTSPALQPRSRIDFVWVRGLTPTDAWVPVSTASDHRMVVVELKYQP